MSARSSGDNDALRLADESRWGPTIDGDTVRAEEGREICIATHALRSIDGETVW